MHEPGDPTSLDLTETSLFLADELDVEVRSTELRKELSLPNLVFTQVLSILGLSWIGTAGKLGLLTSCSGSGQSCCFMSRRPPSSFT